MATATNDEATRYARELLAAEPDRVIKAIKQVRERFGGTLLETKNLVFAVRDENVPPPPPKAAQERLLRDASSYEHMALSLNLGIKQMEIGLKYERYPADERAALRDSLRNLKAIQQHLLAEQRRLGGKKPQWL